MRVTIIPADGFVSVDGEGFSNLDLSFMDSDIHAIQWYDEEGEIEKKDKKGNIISNEKIESMELYQLAIDKWKEAKNNSLIEPEENLDYVPHSISRRQCAVELRERNLITPEEALKMTKYGDVPSMISHIFESMSSNDKIIAETDFAADVYLRDNPLLNEIMSASGATDEEIDDFFRLASER